MNISNITGREQEDLYNAMQKLKEAVAHQELDRHFTEQMKQERLVEINALMAKVVHAR